MIETPYTLLAVLIAVVIMVFTILGLPWLNNFLAYMEIDYEVSFIEVVAILILIIAIRIDLVVGDVDCR